MHTWQQCLGMVLMSWQVGCWGSYQTWIRAWVSSWTICASNTIKYNHRYMTPMGAWIDLGQMNQMASQWNQCPGTPAPGGFHDTMHQLQLSLWGFSAGTQQQSWYGWLWHGAVSPTTCLSRLLLIHYQTVMLINVTSNINVHPGVTRLFQVCCVCSV